MERVNGYSVETLFKGLRNLLASLPSEEEQRELLQTLSETRDFLDEMKGLIEAFPTIESSRELSQGMSRLDILADRASNHGPLRKLMGLKGSNISRQKSVNGELDVLSRALKLEDLLKQADSSEVIGLLERSGEPVSVLIEVARHLGLRTRKKERKAELINRIESRITNQRGYDILRGTPSHAGEKEALSTAVG